MSAIKGGDCTSKKTPTHSYSVSHVSITGHISIQQFSEKTGSISETNFLCERFHQSTEAQGGNIVVSFLVFTFRFLF